MKKRNWSLMALLTTGLSFMGVTGAQADIYEYTGAGNITQGQIVDVDGNSVFTSAGGIALMDLTTGSNIITFCLDVDGGLNRNVGQLYIAEPFTGQIGLDPRWGNNGLNSPAGDPIAAARAIQNAAQIYGANVANLTDTQSYSALQLAIWESLYDTGEQAGVPGLNMGTGRFAVDLSLNPGAVSVAQSELQDGNFNHTGLILVPLDDNGNPIFDLQEFLIQVNNGTPGIGITKQVACVQPGTCGTFGPSASGFAVGSNGAGFCYQITVTNSGSVTLSNLSVIDNMMGDLTTNFFAPGATLAPGASVPAYFKTTLTNSFTNIVTVVGQAANSAGTVSNVTATSSAKVTIDQAGISCNLTVSSLCNQDQTHNANRVILPACSNCVVTFNLFITNTGNANLTNVIVISPDLIARGCGMPPAFNLPVGGSTNFSCAPSITCSSGAGTINVSTMGFVAPDSTHCGIYDITGSNTLSAATTCSASIQCAPDVSSVSGVVFLNCNGANVSSGTGLTNLTVTLQQTNGTVVATTHTSATGAYSFSGLTPGVYVVVVTGPAGYVETFPSGVLNGHLTVTLVGCANTVANFGYADRNTPVFNKTLQPIVLFCNPALSTISTGDLTLKATDDRGSVPVSITYTDTVNGCSGMRVITYTATGTCGTTLKTNQLVTWTVDLTPPVLTCPPDVTLSNTTIVCCTYAPSDYCSSTLLNNCFSKLYTGGFVQCGVSNGYCLKFTSGSYAKTFFSCTGTPSYLKKSYSNPTTCEAGTFASDVLCLKLNVDCGDNKSISGFSGGCGDLVLCDSTSPLNGKSCRQILDICHTALGGGDVSGYGCTISYLHTLCGNLNCSFSNSTPSTWCQGHLIPPTVANTSPSVTGYAKAIDNCDTTPTITHTDSITAGPCAGTYTISRVWTAVDDCGNSTNCTQTITFGNTKASVCGYVFKDCNGDGRLTAGIDFGISNILVTLKNSSGTIVASNLTDGQGSYCFFNLTAGTYSVCIVQPTGHVQTGGCHTNHWLDTNNNDCWNENDGYQHWKGGDGVDCWTANDGYQHYQNSSGYDCWKDKYGTTHSQSCTYTSCNIPKNNCETFTLAPCESKSSVNFSYQGTTGTATCSVSGPSKGICGQQVTYSCTVSNTGTACFTGCKVTACGTTYTCPTLSPGQSCTIQIPYTCKFSDYGTFKCQATASCSYNGSSNPCTAQSSCNTQVGYW